MSENQICPIDAQNNIADQNIADLNIPENPKQNSLEVVPSITNISQINLKKENNSIPIYWHTIPIEYYYNRSKNFNDIYEGLITDSKPVVYTNAILYTREKKRIYQGGYKNCVKHGFGVFYNPVTGGIIFEGQWENDWPINGKAYDITGQKIEYQGKFLNGKCDGIGTYYTCNKYGKSETIYKGSFKDGAYDGHGILLKTNGKYFSDDCGFTYNGNFSNGEKNGLGEFVYGENKSSRFSGMWKDNSEDGEGKIYKRKFGSIWSYKDFVTGFVFGVIFASVWKCCYP